MRTTIVPAQITTVEDRIIGNVSLPQLMLLVTPIFTGSALFAVLPPFFGYTTYKIVAIVCIAVLSGLLAIRIRGMIVLFWLITLLRYNLRARYYVLDKNDTHLRESEQSVAVSEIEVTEQDKRVVRKPLPRLSTAEIVQVEELLTNPAVRPRIEVSKKGIISVHLTETAQ